MIPSFLRMQKWREPFVISNRLPKIILMGASATNGDASEMSPTNVGKQQMLPLPSRRIQILDRLWRFGSLAKGKRSD
ncbi:hypothetical protein DdX_10533 [Ditylenchus destructor]|uniref:Uncharacterized protein n=1 Tax=Ditylenchus destructor TaxID=166010 RepID=A0AAD4R5I9_9BILA|nr:hypothetical protein DdX_10533 [Ditylenchus destructor]